MKVLFCLDCGDMIAPLPKPRSIRVCNCERHAVWWENPQEGQIRVCDFGPISGRLSNELRAQQCGAPMVEPRCYLIGIDNNFLLYKGELGRKTIKQIAESAGATMMFRSWESCVVRFRPGETSDSAWSDIPEREGTVH